MGTETNSAAIALNKAATVSNELNRKLMSLAQTALATYSAYKLLSGAVSATSIGIQANSAWESQKLSIASIVSSTNQLADAQGRVLEGAEKFIASQHVAEELMKRIQQLGLETTATTQELVTGFQAIIAPALKAGYALEEIPELATRAAQAMGAFQIPIQQMRTEVEALLSGNINKAQDLLAPYLNISKELVKEWKAQGILVEEINKRLESFKYSGDAIANTWEGLVSNTKEYVEFISRGSTDGLFNSMKQSARELQSLMITMNQKTGLAEVSSKVSNLTSAWERMNDVIGNKIIVATMKFTDWIEELNRPGNLAELERSVSNIGLFLEDASEIASKVALEVGGIAKRAIDGYNELPEWMRDMGLVGAFVMGKRGWLALGAASALIDRGKDFATGIDLFVNTGKMSMQELSALSWDKLHELVEKADKFSKESAEKSKQNFTSAALATTASLKREYEQRERDLKDALEQEYRNLKAYQEASKVPLVGYIYDDKTRDSQEHINELQERLSAINLQLEYTFEKSFAASQAVGNIGVSTQSLDEMPLQQLVGTIHNLQTGAYLFARKLFGAKEAVSDLDGSTAIVSLDFQYTIPEKKGLDLFGASGGTAVGWLEQQIGALDSIYGRIEATSSLGGRAADDGKKKAKQIESALHSVESELNRLQMTDAQFKQWQVNEKVEKLEKLLGASNPKVIELRAALEKELHDNILKDILSYADPAAAAVAKVDKEYQDFLSNIELLKKSDPARYTQLMTKAETEHEKALRKAERASKEQNEHLQEKLSFYKELEEMSGAFGLSLEVQNRLLDEQMEIFRDADIPENLIQTWREYKDLMNSHDWADGAQRAFLQYRADATDAAKGAEEAFSGLYSGMDSGWKSAWEQMIETGKVSLSSFKSLFASFLADLMHMAITRPITVQIAGVVSGMLGTGGVAYAAGGNSGSGGIGLGNLPFSSLLPDSWTSGVSSFLSYELPGTAPGISGLYGPTMGGGNLASGLSLGSALMYGGLGSLGYSLLGGALGLPQNKYSGITSGLGAGLGAWGASAALSGTALGATLGSAVPVVGTVIGAALGGLASSLFGGGKKTHPSVYTNVVDASLFGSDWEALMTQGAWTDRASVSDAAGIFKGLGEVANTTASSIMGFAQALPEEYQAQVLARLNAETVSFGRGSTAGRKGVTDYGPSTWNFQFHDEEQLQEVINTAGEDIQRVMLNALQRAMAGTDLSSMLTVDLSSTEGLDKAIQAINAINTVTEATANIKEPLSEMEQQAKAVRAQLDEWTESMRSLGVNADYAGKLMEDYRHAYIDNVIESLDDSLHPLSAYAQAVKAANEAVDQRKKALEIIGATESQLAQVEAMRAEVVKQATEEMLRSFDQSVAQRWAAVNGNSDEVGRAISQANELRETIQRFGEGSAQVAELLKLHAAETAKAVQDAAKAAAESFRQTYAQRYATLTGDTNGLANLQQQASFSSELAEIEKMWGEGFRAVQADAGVARCRGRETAA